MQGLGEAFTGTGDFPPGARSLVPSVNIDAPNMSLFHRVSRKRPGLNGELKDGPEFGEWWSCWAGRRFWPPKKSG